MTTSANHNHATDYSNISITDSVTPVTNKPPKTSDYRCESCPYTTPWRARLTAHLISHSDLRPYPCEHCSYRAKQKSVLKHHVLTKHSDHTPFHCEICPYRCKAKHLLQIHLRSKHEEGPVRVLECDKCDYTTCYPGNLQLHTRTHSGKRMFTCTECEFKSRQKASLRVHMSVHSDSRTHPCEFCNYRAKDVASLERHVKMVHLRGREKGDAT